MAGRRRLNACDDLPVSPVSLGIFVARCLTAVRSGTTLGNPTSHRNIEGRPMSSAARKMPGTQDVYSLKGKVSAEEWAIREDLAATYRLVAIHGWDDMIFTHISARVPGPEHHFLINPYGYFFNEITASSLVKVDLEGNIVEPTDYFINPAGFTIHSAIHAARENA